MVAPTISPRSNTSPSIIMLIATSIASASTPIAMPAAIGAMISSGSRIEIPKYAAAAAMAGGGVTIDSNAELGGYALDTIAFLPGTTTANPFFGTYQFFPRIGSYGGGTFNVNGQELDVVSFVRDQSHGYLSPHVQVSFPVTDRTNFRLSYSHQVQAPDFGLLLGGINIDLGNTNTNQVFGSDLDFGKTIAFEFGIRHAFSDDMVLDVAAYNKDIVSDPAARLVSLFDPAQGRGLDLIKGDLEPSNAVGGHAAAFRRSISLAQFQGSSSSS